jgi:hypothetical protein
MCSPARFTVGTYAAQIAGYASNPNTTDGAILGMPRALLKLVKRSLPMIRLRDFELLVNNLIVMFV